MAINTNLKSIHGYKQVDPSLVIVLSAGTTFFVMQRVILKSGRNVLSVKTIPSQR